jgi:hypothetical protein
MGNITIYAAIFYPICAIASVGFLSVALILAVRGMMVLPHPQNTKFKVLFAFAAVFALIFFPAVMNYQWLSWGSNPYDVLYHTVGYFGSVAIMGASLGMAAGSKLLHIGDFFKPLGICWVLFLAAIASAAAFAQTPVLPQIIGLAYASLQIFLPLLEFLDKKHKIQQHASTTPPVIVADGDRADTNANTPDRQ